MKPIRVCLLSILWTLSITTMAQSNPPPEAKLLVSAGNDLSSTQSVLPTSGNPCADGVFGFIYYANYTIGYVKPGCSNTPVPPEVVDVGSQTYQAGDVVSLQIEAYDPNGDEVAYSASDLPPGLEIDLVTGLITGNLDGSSTGDHSATITVTDGDLSTDLVVEWAVSSNIGLTFNASSTEINEGYFTILSWDVSNVTSCWPEGPWGWSGTEIAPLVGSKQIEIPTDGSYPFKLTCKDAQDTTNSSNVLVVVKDTDIVIDFSVEDDNLVVGESSELSWSVSNADHCDTEGGTSAWGDSEVTIPSGDLEVTFLSIGDVTFTLECTNTHGKNESASVTVAVASPLPPSDPETPPAAASLPIPSAQDIAKSSRVGSTNGQFRVDEAGSATYSIPILTAPGSGGVAPHISLNYSSQAGNGLVGVGWNIGGLSSITRCAQTIEQDSDSQGNPPTVRSVTLSDSDRYCLDGQRLLLVSSSGSYGDVGTEYRTEIDNIARVKLNSGGASAPYFTVERKDGSISEYGNTDDSRIEARRQSGDSVAVSWAQNRFQDSAGNYMSYEYFEAGDGDGEGPVESVIEKISYTGNVDAGTQPYAELRFEYEGRNDVSHAYVGGTELKQSKLLDSIVSVAKVKNTDSSFKVLRAYHLEFGEDGFGRSALSEIEECNNASKSYCFPPTTFGWIKSFHEIESGLGQGGVLPTAQTIYGLQLADVNGDGRPDLIYTLENGSDYYFYVKTSTKSGAFNTWNNGAGYLLPKTKTGSAPRLYAIDLNADGFQDVIYREHTGGDTYNWKRRISSGTGFGPGSDLSVSPWDFELDENDLTISTRITVVDFNGDGLSDLLNNKTERLTSDNKLVFEVALNTGDSSGLLAEPIEYTVKFSNNLLPVGTPQTEVYNEYVYAAKTPEGELLKNKVFDYNGDGKVDLLRLVWRQYRKCKPNTSCSIYATPGPTTIQSDSGLDSDYDYFQASFWVVISQTDTLDLEYKVVAKGEVCNLANSSACQSGSGLESAAYLLPVDINADGLADLAYTNGANGLNNVWYYQMNTGDGFADKMQINDANSRLPAYTNEQVRFEDMNGDGYPDLVYPSDIENQNATWRVLYNNFGNEFAAEENTGLFAGDLGEDSDGLSGQNDVSVFADFTGNGKLDQLYINFDDNGKIPYSSSGSGLYEGFNSLNPNTPSNPYNDDKPSNVIEIITNGLGAETTLEYLPLTDTAVYSRMHDAPGANWGEHNSVVYDLVAPMYVVRRVTGSAPTLDSVGATSSIEYHYVGAKMQGGGRGFLGFGEIVSFDTQSKIRTNTRYRQDFPFVGMPAETMRASSANSVRTGKLSDTSSSTPPNWSAISASTVAAAAPGGYRLSYAINEWGVETTAGDALYPYLKKSLERSYTLAGSFDHKVLTENTYGNGYGNLKETTVRTYATDSLGAFATQITDNGYNDNVAKWHLGRLSSSSVTHQRAGKINITRYSSFEYDGVTGILVKEIIEPDSEFEVETTYTLDDFGNRLSTTVEGTNMAARDGSVVYDSLGRFVTESTNAVGQTTQKLITWDVFGNPLRTENIDGVESINAYDLMGRLLSSKTASIGTWTKSINTWGPGVTPAKYCPDDTSFHTTIMGGGIPTAVQCFDMLGRTIRSAAETFSGMYAYTDQFYDSSGRVTLVSEPYFSTATPYWNETAYDALGRMTSFTNAADEEKTITYNHDVAPSCATQSIRVVKIVNELDQERVEVKNALGENVYVYDDLCGEIFYDYDAVGNLTSINGVDNETVTMNYDLAGRKISMNDPDKGEWEYAYNALGELERQYDSKNQATDFTYDLLGRVKTRRELSGVLSIIANVYTVENKETSVYFDSNIGPGKGQLSSVTYIENENGAVLHKKLFEYDGYGRVAKVETTIGGETFEEDTTYDQYGRVFQQFDASGDYRGIRYVYSNGYLAKLKEAREGTAGVVYQDILAMDARGNVTEMEFGNGVIAEAEYHPDSGRLKLLKAKDAENVPIQNVEYIFDALGNLKQRHDTSDGVNLLEDFDYDELNRLEYVDRSVNSGALVRTLTLEYNAAGNITNKSDVGVYQYNATQPHAVSKAGSNFYYYDANGNQTSGGGRSIDYTVFDKPSSISKGNSTVDFAYGIGNSRYQREDYVGTALQKTTLYLGSTERITKFGNTSFKRYLGGVAISTFDTSTESQQLEYLLKDHIGSIHTVLDDTGDITAKMHFTAFGERQNAAWDAPPSGSSTTMLNDITTRGFTGHEQVDAAGIVHMNGRIYDPKLGRMLQADPLVQAPKNGQSLNRYTYVYNNPLSYTDPSGYSALKNFMKATGMWATHKFFNSAPVLNSMVGAGLNYVPYCAVWCSAVWNANSTYVATGSVSSAFKSGAIAAGAGYATQGIAGSDLGLTGKVIAAGTVGGIAAELQGGKFGHGFLSAGVGYAMGSMNGGNPTPGKFVAATIVGGTVSELTGGKFANGAFSSGMSYAIATLVYQRRGQVSTSDSASNKLGDLDLMQSELDALVENGTLDPERRFKTPDAAAKEVLSVSAPLSESYGYELAGNIIERTNGYVYTTPKILGPTGGELSTNAIGYHTHPSGNLVYSNQFYKYGPNGDTQWVRASGYDLYLGVKIGNTVSIGVCSPGSCPNVGFRGTAPSRIVE